MTSSLFLAIVTGGRDRTRCKRVGRGPCESSSSVTSLPFDMKLRESFCLQLHVFYLLRTSGNSLF